MAVTYHGVLGQPFNGQYAVIRKTNDPAYSVVAVCESESRATQIASLLTADEA